jgi:hypothetical protein
MVDSLSSQNGLIGVSPVPEPPRERPLPNMESPVDPNTPPAQ